MLATNGKFIYSAMVKGACLGMADRDELKLCFFLFMISALISGGSSIIIKLKMVPKLIS